MTAPRQILPGTTYLVTRRCAQRQFLLQPCSATNSIFLYLLGAAADRFGIQLHAFCVLSNHYHLVLTDPGARLPAFGQYLDSLVARALNASLGKWEAFWAPGSYSAVALVTPDDVVDKAAYVLANPVAAGLVQRASSWAGLWSAPERIDGDLLQTSRPESFFRTKGNTPASVRVALVSPPGFEPGEFRRRLEAALTAREERAAVEPRPDAVVPAAAPVTREPRRRLRPRTACHDPALRKAALSRLRAFLVDYREALNGFRRGLMAVVFPRGTYWLRVHVGVRCVESG